ncbi:MAG: enoyl-CoA hydratase/isomerase family protein [Chloroflexi bacterium]|nr:enoyl-CoA hydratase/isomerase family protein [Chloroflexota bacterium]
MAIVEYEKKGHVAIITINRPEKLNALSWEVHRGLRDAMLDYWKDDNLRAAILTGAGDRAFSAGNDLGNMGDVIGISGDRPKAPVERVTAYHFADTLYKPFIAAIHGWCLGGGLEMALTCDIRITADNAKFGLPEMWRGILPGTGMQLAPRAIPRAIAAEMVIMGRNIDAQRAYEIGLVNAVVSRAKLMPTAMEWAEAVCEAAPLAVKASKENMNRSAHLSLDDALEMQGSIRARTISGSEDQKEGVKAFLEKRKPDWKGR